MTILILNHYATTPEYPGGTRHHDLAIQLMRRGHNVTVVASGFHHPLLRHVIPFKAGYLYREDVNGIDWYWIRTPAYRANNWRRFANIVSYYRRVLKLHRTFMKQRPDVIIGSTIHPFAPLAAIKLAKKYRLPYVLEIRDLWPQSMLDMRIWSRFSPFTFLFRQIEKRIVNRADAIVVLAPNTVDYLSREYNYHNATYVPNGVDLEAFDHRFAQFKQASHQHDTILKLRALKTNRFIVAFTGAVNVSNNIDLVLDTASEIQSTGNKDILIAIVGQGQEVTHLKGTIRQKALNNVQIFQPVSKNLLPRLLHLADALLLVQGRVMWGSTNKLFDYMAAAKPIITALPTDHNNPVKHLSPSLSVASLDPHDLARAILSVRNMKVDDRLRIGKAFRNEAEEKYNMQILAGQLESLLLQVSLKSQFKSLATS